MKSPSRNFHFGLIALVGLNLLPHIGLYTLPVALGGGACLLWRVLFEYQKIPLPNNWLKTIFVFGSCFWVFSTFGTLMGLEAGSALLILGISLKLIDRSGYHDAMVTLFLVFMLLLVRFLESQSLWITLFGAFDLIAVTALLVELHSRSRTTFEPLTLLRVGGRLLLQITPFMVLLFFIFPRFSASFLQIQSLKTQGSGFSDEMNPGDISQIALSNEVAFRVSSTQGMPRPEKRYWRGAILTGNQGLKWVGQKAKKIKELLPKLQDPKNPQDYDIVLEPRFGKWIFAPDVPHNLELINQKRYNKALRDSGHVFSLKKETSKHLVYRATSTDPLVQKLSAKERRKNLQSPEETDARVLALVEKLDQTSGGAKAKAYRLMSFFRKNFRYTLSPGGMKKKSISEFLFIKKVGFCEHFAGSFAYLMRLSGIPARVVVGFQGAQKNEFSDYYIVRDKDAHAWTEIWLDTEGRWMRFDPTQVVAPLRLELGGEVFHDLTETEQALNQTGLEYMSSYQSSWFVQTRFAIDLMASNWNLFMINYNREGQKRFLSQLGFFTNQVQLFIISILTIFIFIFWTRRTKRRQRISPVLKTFLNLSKALQKQNMEKEFNESSYHFLTRCQTHYPNLHVDFQIYRDQFSKHYFMEKKASRDDLRSLREHVRNLSKQIKNTTLQKL